MPDTVSDVMGPIKVRFTPAESLRQVAVALAAARTGLGIVDVEGGGVITERDVLRAIAGEADLDVASVAEWMTLEPVSVPPDSSLDAACALMITRGVRHLLVGEGETIIGVLNMRDVVGVMSGAAPLGAVPPAREG